jgi:hypothetical protein
MIPNLSKEMIDILQQLRKRLRSEFGVELKLSQLDIIQQIFALIEKSHDQRSLLLFADLEDMMGVDLRAKMKSDFHQSHSASNIERVYRGQINNEKAPASEVTAQITKRIYRGQVVI